MEEKVKSEKRENKMKDFGMKYQYYSSLTDLVEDSKGEDGFTLYIKLDTINIQKSESDVTFDDYGAALPINYKKYLSIETDSELENFKNATINCLKLGTFDEKMLAIAANKIAGTILSPDTVKDFRIIVDYVDPDDCLSKRQSMGIIDTLAYVFMLYGYDIAEIDIKADYGNTILDIDEDKKKKKKNKKKKGKK
jgi:hypothetical protein